MAISDIVVSNLTIFYLALIAIIKVSGEMSGRSYGGAAVLVLSTAVVGVVLVVTLMWDVSRKVAATCKVGGDDVAHEMCRGGICWHGVAVKSPVSEIRFRLPDRH